MKNIGLQAAISIETGMPSQAAQYGLTQWHNIVASADWDKLPVLLAEDVVFRNPAAIESHHGRESMVAILRRVFGVMQDFKYLRHYGNETGYVLEFSAGVGDEIVFGVDLIEFNKEGKIIDFMVMMRPASTVLMLAAEAGKLL